MDNDVKYRVISADNHILEPPTLFVERVPARFREAAPRIVRGKDGGDGWSFDGSIPESTIGLPHGRDVHVRGKVRWRRAGPAPGVGIQFDTFLAGAHELR